MKKASLRVILYIAVFVILIPFLGIVCMLEFYDFKFHDRLDYNEWTAELGSKLETDIASSFHQKFLFVNLNGAVRNLLGQREMNHVIKLNNGKLIQTHPRLEQEAGSLDAVFYDTAPLESKDYTSRYLRCGTGRSSGHREQIYQSSG